MLVLLYQNHHCCHGEHWPGEFAWTDLHCLVFGKKSLFLQRQVLENFLSWNLREHNKSLQLHFASEGLDEGICFGRWNKKQKVVPKRRPTNVSDLFCPACAGAMWKLKGHCCDDFLLFSITGKACSNSWCGLRHFQQSFRVIWFLSSFHLDFNHDQWPIT